MKTPVWIWYFGDFERYHNMKISMRRTMYGCFVPAFWKVSDCNRCVRFRKTVTLKNPDKILFVSDGKMGIKINGKGYKGPVIELKPGTYTIIVTVYNPYGIPALYVKGKEIISDGTWQADIRMTIYGADYIPVGYWNLKDKRITPTDFCKPTKKTVPNVLLKKDREQILDFGKEVNLKLCIHASGEKQSLKIFYGESPEEVKSDDFCVLKDEITINEDNFISEVRGCRYVRIAGKVNGEVYGLCEFMPKNKIGSFKSDSKLLNKIYNISKNTYDLTSNLFFVDGIKRDCWIWGGDAYQSMMFDFYYSFDKDIIKRTLIALRGIDPIASHINGIVDYTFYWIISINEYYLYTGDKKYIEMIYGSVKSMLEYCKRNLDKNGLFVGDDSDWTFVDWADTEKSGAVCAIQMLYCKALYCFSQIAKAIEKHDDYELYKKKYDVLKVKINKLYWNEEFGGYITSITDGKATKDFTRHANIFAIVFDIASFSQKKKILENVLKNDNIPRILTPFFSFFEYDALCKMGEFKTVRNKIEEYFGSMANEETGTFWEEYDPDETTNEKYRMYGRPYEKSLCHAWGASPLYFIGRYFMGVVPTKPGYEEFEINPNLFGLKYFKGKVPINNGFVEISANEYEIRVFTDADGGLFKYGNIACRLEKNKEYVFSVKKGD